MKEAKKTKNKQQTNREKKKIHHWLNWIVTPFRRSCINGSCRSRNTQVIPRLVQVQTWKYLYWNTCNFHMPDRWTDFEMIFVCNSWYALYYVCCLYWRMSHANSQSTVYGSNFFFWKVIYNAVGEKYCYIYNPCILLRNWRLMKLNLFSEFA